MIYFGLFLFPGNLIFGPRSEIIECKCVLETKYGNSYSKPMCNKIVELPWAGTDKFKIGEILCEPMWQDGTIQEACPRYVARKQLQNLESMGLKLMCACEAEFLLVKDGKPLFEGTDYCTHVRFSDVEELMLTLDSNLRKCGIESETMEVEYSPGQVEFAFVPKFGIEAADNMFRFKTAVKEIAKKSGITAVFMSKPFAGEDASSGTHFNHSLWNTQTNQNAFYDPNETDHISSLGKYWIGGVIKHMEAVTALCCPTINCYRHLHTPWVADKKDWDYDSRLVSLRIKSTSEKATYMENRIPSGASNIYLVLAATVAAGIDGIKNKIEPPAPGLRLGCPLPFKLEEALDALEKDETMVKALGEEFVEWFLIEKREVELKKFGKHDMTKLIDSELKAEQDEYFEMI